MSATTDSAVFEVSSVYEGVTLDPISLQTLPPLIINPWESS